MFESFKTFFAMYNLRSITTILFLFISLKYGFCQSSEQYLDNTINVSEDNVPTEPSQYYFPKDMFPFVEMEFFDLDDGNSSIGTETTSNKFDKSTIEWYSSYLFAMKEPLLFNKKLNKEVYRFIWLRTYDKPVAIRIEKGDTYKLFWKMLDGAGGYKPEALILEESKDISDKEWSEFTSLITKSDFFNLPLGRDAMANDKSEWILEGNAMSKYHVTRQGAPTDGDFYNACNYLLQLTGLEIPADKKY